MKKLILLTSVLLLCVSSFAQSNFKEKTVFKNDDIEIRQLDEHTWHGNGNLCYNESVYLIEGEKSAILIDAGTKIPGLRKIVEGIVNKPVTLVATHVHGDHTGSAIEEWECIWLNAADLVNIPDGYKYPGEIKYLKDGQIFDLGGRTIEVVFTPGHTPGSVTYIDKDKHYGFSGDAFGSGNLLVFTDLSTEIASCKRFQRFIDKYDLKYFYPGHYWGDNLETPQRVKDVSTICEGILEGKFEPTKGSNNSIPFIVDKFGVKINYGEKQIR